MTRQGPWTRLLGMLAAGVLVALNGCGGESTNSPGKLVVVLSGGSYSNAFRAAYVQPFEIATGIKVEVVDGIGDRMPQIQAQEKSGNVLWDVSLCGTIDQIAFPDLWAKIDESVVKSSDQVLPDAIGKTGVLVDLEAYPLFAYSTKAFPSNPPKTWTDFFDTTAFPGPRGVPNIGLDSAWAIPAVALFADGVASDALLPMDLDRAYKKLNALKPRIRAFYPGFSQAQDLMRSGDIVMGIMTDGRALQLLASGASVGLVWNQAFIYRDELCTLKGAPNEKNANLFYKYIYDHPEQQATFSSFTLYGPPTNAGATALQKLEVNTHVKDSAALHAKEMIPDSQALLDYVQKNSDALLNRWNTYISGG